VEITLLGMLLSSRALMAYWGSATWLPPFLASAKGLNVVKTGGFLIMLNVGAFLGYQFFGWMADRKGRRLAFIYGIFGAFVSELFPTSARATGTSLVWNIGRAMSMLSPIIIGALAEGYGLSFGLGVTVVFNLLGLVAVYFLPDTVKAGVKLFNSHTPGVDKM